MGDTLLGDRIFQGPDHGFLPQDVFKDLGPPFSGQYEVFHGYS